MEHKHSQLNWKWAFTLINDLNDFPSSSQTPPPLWKCFSISKQDFLDLTLFEPLQTAGAFFFMCMESSLNTSSACWNTIPLGSSIFYSKVARLTSQNHLCLCHGNSIINSFSSYSVQIWFKSALTIIPPHTVCENNPTCPITMHWSSVSFHISLLLHVFLIYILCC